MDMQQVCKEKQIANSILFLALCGKLVFKLYHKRKKEFKLRTLGT